VTGQDFSQRSTATELMDTEPTSFEEFDGYLRDLERVNVLTLAYRPTLAKSAPWPIFREGWPISVLDVGSGRGGRLRRLRKWARGKNLQLDLTGVDINPWSTKSAAESTPPEMYIRFETADILAQSEPLQTDFVLSSSFTHHLDDADLVGFIRQMDRYAAHGWFINHLHRHILPYCFIKYATRLLPVHRMARNDGPISVARALQQLTGGTCWLKSASRQSGCASNGSFPFAIACRAEKRYDALMLVVCFAHCNFSLKI
jgi:SAM-dependent methyltransferase